MRIVRLILLCTSFAAVAASLPALAQDQPNPLQPGETWEALRPDVLGEGPLVEDGQLALDAPVRAHDPALVPVHLTQPEGAGRIEELVLVVDENPAPVAATFTLSEAMHPLDMEVRVRVNAYSNLRAVATIEGAHVMAGRFVKATGGCAAPAGKDAAAALAHMGEMRFQQVSAEQTPAGLRREAKLMIRHPNYSGLQRDQVTLLNIPAHFITDLEVRQGEDLLFSMSGGISISEDPVFLFRYLDNGAGSITVRAEDTDGAVFQQSFAMEAG